MAIRVYQIAKEYATSSDEVMRILNDAGCPVSSHTSELDQHAVLTIRARLGTYKVTVVDDAGESAVSAHESEAEEKAKPKKRARKKKKVEEAAIKKPTEMTVRVIKSKAEDEVDDEDPVDDEAKEDAKPAPSKPRLKRPSPRKRPVNIKARIQEIQKIAEQRGDGPSAEPADRAPSDGRPTRRPPRRDQRGRPGRPGGDRPVIPDKGTVITAADLSKAFQGRGAGPGQGGPPGPGGPGGPGRGGPPGNRYKGGSPFKPHGKKKKKKRRRSEKVDKVRVAPSASKVTLPEEDLGIIMLSEGVTIKELAEKINRMSKDVIKRLFEKGVMATINDVLDKDLAVDLAKDFGYLAEVVSFEEDLQIREEEAAEAQQEGDEDTEDRAPIVTIMGHVDHGKTSLLDRIRETKVASGEAGGITQHIGAYAVSCNDRDIVFLDTPGHEAFTKMRARGTSVTDIVILVVAADDGVKPQTIEAIHHAQAAKVPILIAINKVDKPEAQPDRVKTMLTEHSLIVEEFGGDAPCVEVSAKTGDGIQDLLEMILLVSEMQTLRANSNRKGKGTVIEARLDRGRGPVATILVQDGSVSVSDYFITGATYGKIRAMNNDLGQSVQKVGPATPVEILGLQDVPQAGDTFQVVEDEATARQISSFRTEKQREEQLRMKKHMSLDQLFSKMKQGEVKELALIIKGDVQGSVEGISHALEQIESEKVHLRVIHEGVGSVTENDVLLAMASDAIIISFNTKTEPKATALADHEHIDIREYSVIYEIIRNIEEAMLGMLAPEYEERRLGHVVVRQIFQVPKRGKVAGSYVDDGLVRRDSKVRVIRDGDVIHDGQISSLKRFKDDVSEVKNGFECGINVAGFDDIQEGDELEVYEMEAVRPTSL